MAEMFYYCKRCNNKVESRRNYCECGRPLWNTPTYTSEEIEKLVQESGTEENGVTNEVQSAASEDGEMVCSICGKRYGIEHSVCNDCGMALQPYLQPNVAMQKDEVSHSPSMRTAQNTEMYGTEIDEPVWLLKVRRYFNRRGYEGRDIIVNRSIMSLGREFLAYNHVFSQDALADSKAIERVSRYNAFLFVRDGNLYIEYDNTIHPTEKVRKKRAPIYVNGVLMKENECRRIMVDDSIIMGNGAATNLDLCVEFVAKSRKNVTDVAMADAEDIGSKLKALLENQEVLIENQGIMKETLEYAENIQRQTLNNSVEIREEIKKLENLQMEKYSGIEEYMKALQDYAVGYKGDGEEKSREEYIREFLGDCEDKDKLLTCMNGAQKEYIYYAAFYDVLLKKANKAGLDYSGIFIYVGKFLENFLYQVVQKFLETYFGLQWEQIKNGESEHVKKRNKPKQLTLGDFTTAIQRARNGEHKGKMFEQIAKDVNRCNLESYVSAENVKNAFKAIEDVRKVRNSSAHSSLEAIMADELVKVEYDEYIKAKNCLFQSGSLAAIAEYYKIIFEG